MTHELINTTYQANIDLTPPEEKISVILFVVNLLKSLINNLVKGTQSFRLKSGMI